LSYSGRYLRFSCFRHANIRFIEEKTKQIGFIFPQELKKQGERGKKHNPQTQTRTGDYLFLQK